MLRVLSKIKKEKLIEIINKDEYERILDLSSTCQCGDDEKYDNEKLAEYLCSFYGNELLYNAGVRRIILESLPYDELLKLASQFKVSHFKTPYDIAFSIANSNWTYKSTLVQIFARDLKVPSEYLPSCTSGEEAVELLDPIDVLPPLLEYQDKMKESMLSLFKGDSGRALLQLPTGAGKTRTIVETIIKYLVETEYIGSGKSVIWLAHTDELCRQAVDTFKYIWQKKGNQTVKLVRLWGKYKPQIYDFYGAFIVSSFQTMYSMLKHKRANYEELAKTCDMLIIDEAHKILAPTYKSVMDGFLANDNIKIVGLSATPGRGSDQYYDNIALAKLFNKNLLRPDFGEDDAITALRKLGVLSKVKRIVKDAPHVIRLTNSEQDSACTYLDLPNSVLKKLAQDDDRNKLIISIINEQIKNNNPCLVFACSVDHARLLCAAVNIHGYKAATVDSTMRIGVRRKNIEDFRQGKTDVLFNYGVLSVGFDAPRIRTVIIARPTNSVVLYSQMIGRGLRGPLMGGTEYCNVVDIKDNYENFGDVEEVYDYFTGYWEK